MNHDVVQVKDNRFVNIDIQNRDINPLLSREEGEIKEKEEKNVDNTELNHILHFLVGGDDNDFDAK
jgi:hypothetical protein